MGARDDNRILRIRSARGDTALAANLVTRAIGELLWHETGAPTAILSVTVRRADGELTYTREED